MQKQHKGGGAVIVLCSILVLLGLVVLIVSPIIGAVAVLCGIAGIIYGVKAKKRYKAELEAEEAKRAADEAAMKEAAARRAEKAKAFAAEVAAIPRVEVAQAEAFAKRRKEKYYPKLTNIIKTTDIQKLFPLVVVDVETTGLKPQGNDIIEVSAIKYGSSFVPESCFTTLCKPRNHIPAEASKINHITDEMVEAAPPFSLIAAGLSEYMKGCNVVGQNVEFDTDFLYTCGVELPETKYFDTCQLARYTLKDMVNYKLPTLCSHYGIYRDDAHRSLSDAYATALVFENLIRDKRALN